MSASYIMKTYIYCVWHIHKKYRLYRGNKELSFVSHFWRRLLYFRILYIVSLFWGVKISWSTLNSSATSWRTYRSFATRVSQLKIWHFWVIDIERSVCRCTFIRYSVITQFAKLAAGEQTCRRCTHRKLYHFKIFKNFSWKITNF